MSGFSHDIGYGRGFIALDSLANDEFTSVASYKMYYQRVKVACDEAADASMRPD